MMQRLLAEHDDSEDDAAVADKHSTGYCFQMRPAIICESAHLRPGR